MSMPVLKQMPPMKRTVKGRVNRGLYLDRSPLVIPEGGCQFCYNVRVRDAKVQANNMGWTKWFATQLSGQVLLIYNFLTRAGGRSVIYATPKDLYQHDDMTDLPVFITPIYDTGTVSVTVATTTVTGSGTLWATGSPANAKAGDYLFFSSDDAHDPLQAWLEIDSITDDTHIELVSPAPLGYSSVPYTIRKIFNGDESNIWDAEVFPYSLDDANADIWYATNGIEMVKWNGSTTEVEIYDPGFVCRSLLYHKNIMLYGHVDDGSQVNSGSVRSSAIGHPENVSTLEAAEWLATDGVDPILTMEPLGDSVVIYCEQSINVAVFVGYPVVYAVRTAVADTGAVSSRSVVNMEDFHEFVGNDQAYRFDGVTTIPMAPQVFKEATRTIDPTRPEKLLTYRDREYGELHFVIPQVSDTADAAVASRAPMFAYVAHYKENYGSRDPYPMTFRELPATSMGYYQRGDSLRFNNMSKDFDEVDFRWNDRFFEQNYPILLMGGGDGYIYSLNTAGTQDGASIQSSIIYPRFPLGDGNRKGVVKRIEPFMEPRGAADYDLVVILQVSDTAEGTANSIWSGFYDMTQQGVRYVSPRSAGRYGQIFFSTDGADQGWEMTGYAISVVSGASR